MNKLGSDIENLTSFFLIDIWRDNFLNLKSDTL